MYGPKEAKIKGKAINNEENVVETQTNWGHISLLNGVKFSHYIIERVCIIISSRLARLANSKTLLS